MPKLLIELNKWLDKGGTGFIGTLRQICLLFLFIGFMVFVAALFDIPSIISNLFATALYIANRFWWFRIIKT